MHSGRVYQQNEHDMDVDNNNHLGRHYAISALCRYRNSSFTVMHYADDAIHLDWQFISDFASRREHNETLCVLLSGDLGLCYR